MNVCGVIMDVLLVPHGVVSKMLLEDGRYHGNWSVQRSNESPTVHMMHLNVQLVSYEEYTPIAIVKAEGNRDKLSSVVASNKKQQQKIKACDWILFGTMVNDLRKREKAYYFMIATSIHFLA